MAQIEKHTASCPLLRAAQAALLMLADVETSRTDLTPLGGAASALPTQTPRSLGPPRCHQLLTQCTQSCTRGQNDVPSRDAVGGQMNQGVFRSAGGYV
eukprot:2018585-Rhodomonas_salina.2